MKDFQLFNDDVLIKDNKIQLIEDEKLLIQKINKVMNTNKKECFYQDNEGIDFKNILKKGVTEEEVKSEILGALTQVDSSFILVDFRMELDSKSRKLTVYFKAENADREVIETSVEI